MILRLLLCLLCSCMMIACQSGQPKTTTHADKDTAGIQASLSANNQTARDTFATDETDVVEDENADAWVLVADTSNDYYALRDIVMQAHEKTGRKIDSIGRYYDPVKDSILVPIDDEDEVWAGSYYPRQSFDDFLSVEYLHLYQQDLIESNTMAAILGIYAQPSNAEAALQAVKAHFGRAHVIKTRIYLGCMH